MSDLVSALIALVPTPYIAIVTGVITAAAAVTALVPTPTNPTLAAVFKLVNACALNVGHARNAPPAPPAHPGATS